jgi:hypothetical protein
MVDLLTLDTLRLARAVNERSAALDLTPTAQVRMALVLLDGLRALAGSDDDKTLRLLWATAPILAARIDLGARRNSDADARIREALEWTPADGAEALFAGEAVDQAIAGRQAELLVVLRDAIDLVPKSILDKDTFVAANFEWLIAARSGGYDVERFYQHWRRVAPHLPPLSSDTAHHLERREVGKGTEAWASFPALTLKAALALMGPEASNHAMHDLLWEAAVFAPKLVSHDLVLAAALFAVSNLQVGT